MRYIFFCLIFLLSLKSYAVEYLLKAETDTVRDTLSGTAVLSGVKEGISLDTEGLKIKIITGKKIKTKFFPDKSGILKIEFSYKMTADFSDGDDKTYIIAENWFPAPDEKVNYKIEINTPSRFSLVTEADELTIDKGVFSSTYKITPPEGINELNLCISNLWQEKSINSGGIEITAYFTPENVEFADKYLKKADEMIQMYSKMLVPYPFKRFSMVDVPFPAGHAMPTMTMLGSKIIKFPFILETSLGHEILHQWFGDLVQTDYETGNWIEGATTYLADHYYQEQQGLGYLFRKDALLGFSAEVNDKNAITLREFKYRTNKADAAVGYTKGMMLFHMVKKEIGDDVFFKSLKTLLTEFRFKTAAWTDIQNIFEKESGKNLNLIFSQMLDKKDLPRFWPYGPELKIADGKYRMYFIFNQITGPYEFDIDVLVRTHTSSKIYKVRIKDKKQKIIIDSDDEPLEVTIDSDYDVARIPTKPETHPSISRLFGDKDLLMTVRDEEKDIYEPLIKYVKSHGGKVINPDNITAKQLSDLSVIIAGKANPMINSYFNSKPLSGYGFNISLYKNPFNRDKVYAAVTSENANETMKGLRKISHYGIYTEIGINDGNVEVKTIGKSTVGITKNVRNRKQVLKVSKVDTIENLADEIISKRVVFIGEKHDEFSHHINQLEIIKALHRRGKKLAVGFEMFQRAYQPVLDDYLAGKISEKEMLIKTEYFNRWGYNYHLYKPILDYIKREKIPAVALNLEEEITKKINKAGILSLSKAERAFLPKEMDYSSERHLVETLRAYRNISEHNGGKFNNFYESMLAWDETMADTASRYLTDNPEKTMVIIAGSGHIANKNGIPERVRRRTGLLYTVILHDEDIKDGIADYVLFPDIATGIESPKMGVYVGENMKIERVYDDTAAKKAGIMQNDVILSLNGTEIKSLLYLKAELFFMNHEEEYIIKLLRDKKEIELKLKF